MPKPAITRVPNLAITPVSTNKNNGLYAPQLTTAQITAIPAAAVANGGIVFNTTTEQFQGYQNNTWNVLNTGASSFVLKRTATAVDYQVLVTDVIIGVDTTGAGRTITLPLVANTTVGQVFIIKDETNNAGTNNITIARNGANIDAQAANKTINQNSGSLRLYSTGAAWFTI
ncbi:MAG: hypothetical protein VKL39_24965 [Leptolyngbyaceae bacterium]|nr:hypothetical protein [Leptolyngbyaceae bacterium]